MKASPYANEHPTTLAELGSDLARKLAKEGGRQDESRLVRELAARVAEQHRAIAYKG